MIRDILNENMTRRQARAALVAAGWRFIGGGSFAAVYGSPDGKVAAKVTKPDRGAEATYRVSTSMPDNPYLPTYYDRLPLANGGHVYEVERLIPFDGYGDFVEAEKAADGNPLYSAAWNALNDAWGQVNDSRWRNAMLRATGELVMTDYLSDMDELAHATVSAGDAVRGVSRNFGRYGSNHWRDAA